MASSGTYGLVMPSKSASRPAVKQPSGAAAAVFGDEDSDEDAPDMATQLGLRSASMQKAVKRAEAALAEDVNAFAYDEVFDQIEAGRADDVRTKVAMDSQKRQPRYIGALIKKTQERKLEQELIEERKVQRERQEEGEAFKDKDSFMTSAYKQKILERKQFEEDLLKRDASEVDVAKEKDMSGFYSNLLTRNSALGASKETTASKTATAAPQQPQAREKSREERQEEQRVRAARQEATQRSLDMLAEEREGERRREEAEIQAKYSRKTTDEGVAAARARFEARKAQGRKRPAVADD